MLKPTYLNIFYHCAKIQFSRFGNPAITFFHQFFTARLCRSNIFIFYFIFGTLYDFNSYVKLFKKLCTVCGQFFYSILKRNRPGKPFSLKRSLFPLLFFSTDTSSKIHRYIRQNTQHLQNTTPAYTRLPWLSAVRSTRCKKRYIRKREENGDARLSHAYQMNHRKQKISTSCKEVSSLEILISFLDFSRF